MTAREAINKQQSLESLGEKVVGMATQGENAGGEAQANGTSSGAGNTLARKRRSAELAARSEPFTIMILCPTEGAACEEFCDQISGIVAGTHIEIVACRSLAEAGRRADATRPAAILFPAHAYMGQELEPLVESLGVVAPGIRRIIAGKEQTLDSPQVAELLMRGQLYDALSFPADEDELVASLQRARRLSKLELAQASGSKKTISLYSQMVGSSPAMRRVFENIRRLAHSNAPVLITGESGTGKELAAKAIHDRSAFSSGNFVAVNCASFPDDLIESELFGHVKGAYTGAASRRGGHVQQAHGGTLFLDEVGEMSPRSQAKLLRFVQEGVYSPLGSDEEIRSTARIIVATNRDLRAEIGNERFRHDLYFRLAMLTLHMPTLRERGDDVELLAKFFLDRFAGIEGRHNLKLSKAAVLEIRRYPWPGNVREMIGAIRRAVVMCHGQLVRPDDLGLELIEQPASPHLMTLAEARARTESELLRNALNHYANNVRQASKALGISRVRLYELIKKYDLGTPST